MKLKPPIKIMFLIIYNFLIVKTVQIPNNSQEKVLKSSEEQFVYLKEAFKDKIKIGSSLNYMDLDKAEESIKNHFNIITPEYDLFPEFIINQSKSKELGNNVNTQVEFNSVTKKFFQFLEDNKIAMHGHTFVWYSQTPNWFFKENFDLNEKYLNDGGGLRRESDWFKIYGDDSFIINAFAYARKYAPSDCKLLISEYNEFIPDKTKDIYDIAMKLKVLGYVDGIGMQSHLEDNFPSFDDYKIAFEKFVSTGLEISINELEIQANDLDKQCNFYRNLFLLYLDNKESISSVILFYINNRWTDRQYNSGLFYNNFTPNHSYYCVIDVINNNK